MSEKAEGNVDASLDEITNSLAGAFASQLNDPNAPHPRFESYKKHTPKNDQHERRRRLLSLQKERRFNAQNHIRKLTEDAWQDDGMEAEEEEEEAMDVTQVKLRRPGKHFKSQLMFSEWMLEAPDDFPSEWLMMPCPVGKRNLVVASRGETRAYAKSGFQLMRFPSALPGGCRSGNRQQSTILDCIYSEVKKTFYILDIMNWNNHPLYDTETECRWYLMRSHFTDNPEPKSASKLNPYMFEPLPSFDCHPQTIQDVMKQDMNSELDGLLFYHKRTHYTFGATPLVLWLKPYMLPEVFGVDIPEKFTATAPSSYQNFQQHVQKVRSDKQQGKTKKTPRKIGRRDDANVGMETEQTVSNQE